MSIVVGGGLAGLVATCELLDAGRRVILVDQEPEQYLGGQAFWSFGGLFFVDSPEQRRMRIKDSVELAWQDWLGTAGFDRLDDEDVWPRRWAEAYVDFAAGEKRAWLHERGVRWFPIVGWAERGGYTANGHGNSVPRFHITWGTGPGLRRAVRREGRRGGAERGQVRLGVPAPSRRADCAPTARSTACAARCSSRRPCRARRRVRAWRSASSSSHAPAVIVTSGGIGGNFDLVRAELAAAAWARRRRT